MSWLVWSATVHLYTGGLIGPGLTAFSRFRTATNIHAYVGLEPTESESKASALPIVRHNLK